MRLPFFILAINATLLGAEKITYDDHIFPIFESSCLNCHNPDKKKGGLDLSTFQGALAGGSGGKVAMAGDGASSKLYTTTIHTEEPVMPPEGDKIEKKYADLIRAWIDGGLLENKSSKARKAKKPSISLAVVDPQKRPEGPLPMPRDLLLEPVIVPTRGTVVNDMDASPWAPLLAVTGQRQILLYQTDSLELVGILPFPYGAPETVSFHPSGKYLLAAGGIGGKSGTTLTWDITTGKLIMTAGKEFDSILSADLRADLGGVALGGPSRLIKLWDTQNNEQLLKIKKHTDWITALSYSPDGVLLATGDRNNGIFIWEAITGNEFHTLRGHQKGIVDLKWRSDSNLLASASEDGEIRFWDMNRGSEVKKTRAHDAVLALDYARDGHLISSGRDKKVKIWKPDLSLKKELPSFEAEITEVAFSHDAKRFFTADWNGHIQGWDSVTFKEIGTLNATPPTIASRLIELNAKTSSLKAAIEATRAALPKHEQDITNAQNWLASLEKKISVLKTEQKTKQGELNEAENDRQKFMQICSENQNLLEKTNQVIKRHRVLANQLNSNRPDLIKELEEARKLENQNQIISSEKQLTNLDQQLAETRAALDQKQNEALKIREKYDGAKKQRDHFHKLKSEHQKRLQEIRNEFIKTEKNLEPARKGLAWQRGEYQKAKTNVAQAVQDEARHQISIKRWQAAAVNTERLKVLRKLDQDRESLALFHQDLQEAAKELDTDRLIKLKELIDTQAVVLSETKKKQIYIEKKYGQLKSAK